MNSCGISTEFKLTFYLKVAILHHEFLLASISLMKSSLDLLQPGLKISNLVGDHLAILLHGSLVSVILLQLDLGLLELLGHSIAVLFNPFREKKLFTN